MALLPILHYPDERLHRVAAPVETINDEIRQLVRDMAQTMYAAPGIGLAATQVDVHKQVIVLDISETHDQLLVLINPQILEARGEAECEEGCLSVPGIYEMVRRAEWIKVRALDRDGQPFTLETSRPAGGVHTARNGPPEGQGVRRVPVAPEADAHRCQAEEAAAPGDVMRLVFAGTPAFARSRPGGPAGGRARHRPGPDPARSAGRARPQAAGPRRSKRWPWSGVSRWRSRSRCAGSEARQRLAAAGAQAMVVAAYGLILPQDVLDLFPLGCINIHASLLPRWRGAAPIQRAILAGDTHTGISIMRMEAGLDTGPVYLQEAIPIAAEDTAASLHDKLAALGAPASCARSTWLRADRCGRSRRRKRGVTYAHKIEKAEAELDWTRDAVELDRQVRAFNPFPVATTRLRGEPLRVWRARPLARRSRRARADPRRRGRRSARRVRKRSAARRRVATSRRPAPGGARPAGGFPHRARRALWAAAAPCS